VKEHAPLIVAIAALLVAGLALVEARRTAAPSFVSHDGYAWTMRDGDLYQCDYSRDGWTMHCFKVKTTFRDLRQ